MGFAGNSPMMETATVSFEHVAYEQIASFYDEAWIADVLFPVKSGKEATVYCCRAHPSRSHDYFALKLYKPLAHRTFRDDAVYQEGRFGRETRAVRAMRKKTAKGRVFQFSNWIEHEFATLKMLFEAGADVPRPFAISANAILLEFLGDGDRAAPPLSTVRLPPEQTAPLLDQARRNIEIMLSRNVVHGDLSAYNVLYCGGRLSIIDFPQSVDPRFNANARSLLGRDVANMCRYFARQGAVCDPDRLAERLWDRFMRAET
jgi:RIO kinase 1